MQNLFAARFYNLKSSLGKFGFECVSYDTVFYTEHTGEIQFLARLVLNTIFTAILVTIIQKIPILKRKHPGARSWFCQHLGILPRNPSASTAQSRSNSSEHMAGTSYLGDLLLETP